MEGEVKTMPNSQASQFVNTEGSHPKSRLKHSRTKYSGTFASVRTPLARIFGFCAAKYFLHTALQDNTSSGCCLNTETISWISASTSSLNWFSEMALITVSHLDLDTLQAFLGESPIWLPLLEAKEDKAEPTRFMLAWGENLSDWSLRNKGNDNGE